jgi:hypothetical protein
MALTYVLVEEQSSAVVIRALARTLGVDAQVRVLEHQGVGDLKRSITLKMKAALGDTTRFIILRDQDNGDCLILKRELEALVPRYHRDRTRVRIACRELEAWYLAQPLALKKAKILKTELPLSLLSRNPDHVADPKEEILRRTHKTGQMWIARLAGPALDPNNKVSRSFDLFVQSLQEAVHA